MPNEIVAEVACPVRPDLCRDCHNKRAEVRRGAKGRLYVSMPECTSGFRTLSGLGNRSILAMLAGAPTVPVPTASLVADPVPPVGEKTVHKPVDKPKPASKAEPVKEWWK